MSTEAQTRIKAKEEAQTRFAQLYEALNSEQKRAVDTIEGPVMVMAGPGTGKTQVLAMRIANILQQTQMDPWNILCLTFTESGVTAMRQRLLSIIGTPAYYVKIHTFHSFCNEIIQDNPELFFWTRNIQVVSDIERVMILRGIVDTLSARSPLKPFGNPYLYFRDIAGNIKDLKQEDISPSQFVEIVSRLGIFTALVSKPAAMFFALKPTERGAGACQDFHDMIVAAAKEAALPDSMRALIAHLWASYEEAASLAEGEREASKARTHYKHVVKKWLQKISDSLPKQVEMAHIYEHYQVALNDAGRLDFEDMIIKVVEALKSNSHLLRRLQEEFQYILVDEYQDTNGAQNDVVDLLGSFDSNPNLFVVGDDKQSIYRFQGASLANMLHFYEKYKESIQVVSLRENYRSQQTILDAAQNVISHNEESVARYVPGVTQELVAVSGRVSERLTGYVVPSEDAEDYIVATRIQELLQQGVKPSEMAVLYRNHRDGQSLLAVLQRLNIPVRLEVGENILDDHLIKAWVALLGWIANGRSDEALAQIVQYSWWHLPPVDTLKVIHYAGRTYRSLYAVLTSPKELRAAGVQQPEVFSEFAEKLAHFRREATIQPLQFFLEMLLVESHFLDHVMEHDEEAAALKKVMTLLNEAKRLNAAHHEFKLEDFVQHLWLLGEHEVELKSEPWHMKGEAVRLMTAHKAKGLEFEHVFVMRLNDKHWGNVREASLAPLPQGLVKYDFVASDTNEDERRLFYVAMTRARAHVYMTRASHNAAGRETVPSLFWQEVPVETLSVDTTQETASEVLQRLQTRLLLPMPLTTRDDARKYILSLLDTYVMSVTHLNNYLECPRKFYFKNLLQIPTAKTKSLALGSAVHGALYVLFAVLGKEKRILSQKEFLAEFERAMKHELLPENEMKDALEQGRHMLAAYYDHYQDEFHDDSLLEYDFVSHNVQLGDLRLTGKVDKIEILDQKKKTINVVDYKTGNVEKGLKKLGSEGDYKRQLVFYRLLCDESPRFPYTFASGEIDFVEEGKKGFVKKKFTVTQEEVDELKQIIARVWGEIKELKCLQPEAGCGKEDCGYCQ